MTWSTNHGNPPENEDVSYDQYMNAFDQLEQKLGLSGKLRPKANKENQHKAKHYFVYGLVLY